MIKTIVITKAYLRLWLARALLHRRNSDRHEFSGLLSPTFLEAKYLALLSSAQRQKFLLCLVDCRNKVGHHGKYEDALG